ncbi:MAG: cytidine deaminase [Clostridia bacterium]|nr:cytidine deaminase [Clostridia bacterium]
MQEYLKLIQQASIVKQNSYSPYSKFKVGAALLTNNGNIYVGTNVENASYCMSVCAERSALCSAISAGEKEFKAIAVVSDCEFPAFPCGACRQVFVEFNPEMDVVISNGKEHKIFKAKELLKDYFELK